MLTRRLRAVLRLEEPRHLAPVLVFLATCAALPVAALLPSLPAFAALAAVNYALDEWLHAREPQFIRTLSSVRLNRVIRFVLRQALLVFLAYRLDAPDSLLMPVLGTIVVHFSLLMAYTAAHRRIRQARTLPVVVRNLDLSVLRIPDTPPALLYDRYLRKFLHLDVTLVAGALVSLATGDNRYALAGCAFTVAGAVLALGLLGAHALRSARMPSRQRVLNAVNWQLAEHRPEVALYFSFAAVSQDFMYQVNMWLETLEKLDRKPVIILRERATFRFLSRTTIPVVCVPKADDLAELDLRSVQVVLYPGNAGKNVHMLRLAEAKHVFIGHGDSDKLASSNRVSKIYDEIWVAGRAGRDRYRRIRHAVDDAAIVEVGRPQLAPVRTAAEHVPGPVPTVLYAPTWEGWSDDDCHTSLIPMGERIVADLLAQDPPVRVVYKPHPLTGRRSPEAAAANERIIAMLRADNRNRDAKATAAAVAAANPRLQEINRRLQEISGHQGAGDDAERTRDAADDGGGTAEEWRRLTEEWHTLFWASRGNVRHNVILKQLPSLYECFNQADVLISDVSSVVSDFVVSLKPYVLTNAEDLSDEEFRAGFTTAGGAFILDRGCTRLPGIINAVRSPWPDPMTAHRRSLKDYVLGPDSPTSMERFNTAVNILAGRSALHRVEYLLDEVMPQRAEPRPGDPYTGAVTWAPRSTVEQQ